MNELVKIMEKMRRRDKIFGRILWGSYFICLCSIMSFFTSCQEDWPELTTDDPIVIDGSAWVKGNYSLNTTAEIRIDSLLLYKGIQNTFAINDGTGKIIEADFIFGDGTAISGNTVPHTYTSTGTFYLKIVFKTADGLTIMSGTVRVLPIGIPEITLDEGVISLYHAMTADGKCQDTLGLAVARIEKAGYHGNFFVTGDFNAWLAPVNATPLTKIRVIGGKSYLVWGITHSVGLEKFGYGKYFPDNSSSWGYAPKSAYWHVNAGGGGEFWLYFTATGISNTGISNKP